MPIRQYSLTENQLQQYQNHSYEYLVLSWFLMAGWEVSKPSVDLGRKIDVQILDGRKPYFIQVKSLDTVDDNIVIENKWKGSDIDYVIYFSKRADWGYIIPAFSEEKKYLKDSEHIKFHPHPKNFLKAFTRLK